MIHVSENKEYVVSGLIPASIEAIVDDLKTVDWEQVLFEAITNSLQANATLVNITFKQQQLELEDTPKYVEELVIEDNGDGFTKNNTESFQNYRTQLKKDLGCKGVGRFFYLKIFEKVRIESLDKVLTFVKDKDITVHRLQEETKKTKVFFNSPKISFSADYTKLAQKIKDHFIAYFKLIEDSKEVVINIYDNTTHKATIKSTDIPKFETEKFNIHAHEFIIDYVFNNEDIHDYDGFYCAGSRVVVRNSQLEPRKRFVFFRNIKILFLLSSKYFDENVNDSRDDFTIKPIMTDGGLFGDLSWKDIHDELEKKIKAIAIKHDIDIDKEAKKSLTKARQDAPYLAYYLDNNEHGLDSQDLIRKAKKKLEEDKETLRNNDKEIRDKFEKIFGIVTQSELAEYIFDRQKKIEQLKKLTGNKALENEIHNLFMSKGTKDIAQDYKSNNLWLFDDRFMVYDKIFSDKQIKEIFPKLSHNINRPDILSIISNTYDKEKITDIVIVELKKSDDKITPARAEEQLLDYASYVNDSQNEHKIRVWTYAFLKFNKEIENKLKRKSYNKIPTHGKFPIYYKYWEEPNTIINFLDYSSLAFDAETRNKTFINILLGKSLEA